MQEYRSGHNEAVLKTVRPKATGVRIPLPAPKQKGHQFGVLFVLLKKRLSSLFFRYYENGVRTRAESRCLLARVRLGAVHCQGKCIPLPHKGFFLFGIGTRGFSPTFVLRSNANGVRKSGRSHRGETLTRDSPRLILLAKCIPLLLASFFVRKCISYKSLAISGRAHFSRHTTVPCLSPVFPCLSNTFLKLFFFLSLNFY